MIWAQGSLDGKGLLYLPWGLVGRWGLGQGRTEVVLGLQVRWDAFHSCRPQGDVE